jgi:hypothetical protein
MMLVDMKIADAAHLKIELAMFGDMIEHMVEEADAGINCRLSGAVKLEL